MTWTETELCAALEKKEAKGERFNVDIKGTFFDMNIAGVRMFLKSNPEYVLESIDIFPSERVSFTFTRTKKDDMYYTLPYYSRSSNNFRTTS